MMNVNVQGLRRNVKNVVRNYTDAQVKVREATSNDPWGAPSTLMGEIADLTYNVVAFTEIMQIVWKRLNDNGKNWRHVYKALVLLEYLIKVGSERVASQCKENIFNIQTLKDFQYVEDNKDQGMHVREKSKQLVSLLKDDERLRQERMRALKAKERFAQNTNVATAETGGTSRRAYPGEELASPRDYRAVLGSSSELESARPQTAGEEELQLQLALAMSKEEAEQEERQRKNDDLRLQMALTESQQEAVKPRSSSSVALNGASSKSSCMDDLLGLNLGGAGQAVAGATGADPWGLPPSQPAAISSMSVDAMPASLVGAVGGLDPWAPAPSVQADPWAPQPATSLPSAAPDPWALNGAAGGVSKGELDEFDLISRQRLNNMSPAMGGDKLGGSVNNSPAPFDMSGLGGALPKTTNSNSISSSESSSKMRKTPESFLGANSNLVNLDALVTAKPVTGSINPFGGSLAPSVAGSASAAAAAGAATATVAAASSSSLSLSSVSSAAAASSAVAPGAMAPGATGGSLLSSATQPPQHNPFQALNKPPTMNELRGGNTAGFDGGFAAAGSSRTTPTPGSVNPFL